MLTIKFNNTEYELFQRPNVSQTHFQASIKNNDYSVDDILADVNDFETITVKTDDEVIGVYEGYTNFIAFSVFPDVISVEFSNVNLEVQLNNLGETVDTQGSEIEALDRKVDDAVNIFGDKAEAADILLGNE